MGALRRVLAVAATVTTLTLLTGAVISTTQVGTRAARWFTSNVPVASLAPAGGGGGQATSVLPPIVISVNSPVKLASKLQLEADVTVTCGPFLTMSSSSIGVALEEASGHAISDASGSTTGLTCDGSPHTYPVMLLATNIPFRPGHGVAVSNASACGPLPEFTAPCAFGSNTQAVDISK